MRSGTPPDYNISMNAKDSHSWKIITATVLSMVGFPNACPTSKSFFGGGGGAEEQTQGPVHTDPDRMQPNTKLKL